jgi:hypothetical protein
MTTELETKPLTPPERYAAHLRAKSAACGKPVGTTPSLEEIDGWITSYEAIEARAELADQMLKDEQAWLIYLAKTFGAVPAGAESSMRIEGRITEATATWGNTTSQKDEAVRDFRNACVANKRADLFVAMFEEHAEYTHKKGAAEQLRIARLSERLFVKLTNLYNACFSTKKKAPSVRVKRIAPPKPAKKARAGKQAA